MGDDVRYAKDDKCCECGQPACCYWPVIDIDIPSHPYCRGCVDKVKMKLLARLVDFDDEVDVL